MLELIPHHIHKSTHSQWDRVLQGVCISGGSNLVDHLRILPITHVDKRCLLFTKIINSVILSTWAKWMV